MDQITLPPNKIDASPTKELFISMLIKDITLNDAIGDLIDNCVDGALALRPNRDYSGLRIDITACTDYFKIIDNCGGISYETAKDYAFRFGRTEDNIQGNNSVGQFGIGMKRALFKMGQIFKISSVSAESSFTVNVDVDEWKSQKDAWVFNFEKYELKKPSEEDYQDNERGTEILISNLYAQIGERFKHDSFINELINEIELEHIINISRGLEITINGNLLKQKELLLINSDDYKPGYWFHDFKNGLKVQAVVGVSDHELKDGGWYLFCNDRKILGPEQTTISGWGAKKELSLKKPSIPVYHSQYDRFRGYIFFNSDDTSLLPWNTSKNNMDIDSPTYRYTKQNMILLMRPVIDFLNNLHSEGKKPDEESKFLEKSFNSSLANSTSVFYILEHASDLPLKFTYPVFNETGNTDKRLKILYYREKSKVEKVMAVLKTTDLKKVGEKTFDYYYENECEE